MLFGRKRHEPSVITRADRAREAGQWQLAAGLYRVALDRKPRNPPIWVQYGHALKECGSPAEAEMAYRTAIGYRPKDADAQLQLGHVLKLQGRTAEARDAYRHALALDSSLAEAARELSQLDQSEERMREPRARSSPTAPQSNTLPIAMIPGPAAQNKLKSRKGSVISRADRARDARQWPIAAELYRKALDRNPHNPPIWIQYGHALKESGDLAEAESAYRAAMARDAGAAEPFLQLGHVLKMRGRCEEAQAAYLRAFALQPSMSEPLSELGNLGWPEAQVAELRQIAEFADVATPTEADPVGQADFRWTKQTAVEWNPETWLTPDGFELGFLQGAVRRKFALGASASGAERTLVVGLPSARATALTLPFVAVGPRLVEISLGSIEMAPGLDLRYALHQSIDKPSLAEGVFHLTSKRGEPQKLAFRTDCFVETGARLFLRVWCDAGDRPRQGRMLVRPFSSDHFWCRRQIEIGFDVAAALPDGALLAPTERYNIGVLSQRESAGTLAFLDALRTGYPDDNVEHRTFVGSYEEFVAWASHLHLCVFLDTPETGAFGIDPPDLAAALNAHGICTAHLLERNSRSSSTVRPVRHPSITDLCHYRIDLSSITAESGKQLPLAWHPQGQRLGQRSPGIAGYPSVRELRARFWPAERLPRVAVVSILYNKVDVLETFLAAIYRQNYPGEISVVLLDDASPGDAYPRAESIVRQREAIRPPRISVRLLRNPTNVGNCASRNRGIREVEADIYIVIDADCLINRGFVSAHVRGHLVTAADAVIGPFNIETEDRPGWEMLEELEGEQDRVLAAMNLQDDLQPSGFVNCITRNLSIRESMVRRLGGYDLDLGYSADPESGYGWEDVEFGYRLYAAGGQIHFTPDAFSLHQSHPSAVTEQRQVIGSVKNFNRLIDKHPEMMRITRRWAGATAERIIAWAEKVPIEHPELERLRERFQKSRAEIAPFLETWRTAKRRLRIVSYRWHVPHQYEIYKLPHDFTLLTGTGTGFTDGWEPKQRPLRPNVRFLPAAEFDRRDYDLAILHFDENALSSDLSNGILGEEWGRSFQWFLRHVDLPSIAVCHGTVPFIGQFGANPDAIAEFEPIEEERLRLVEALRDIEVVCNSHQAAQEWQFHRQRVIWHGIDPQEFPPGTHELGVVSHGLDRYRPHYRGLHVLRRVADLLGDDCPIAGHDHDGLKLTSPSHPAYAELSYRRWIDHLRRFKIYLNTTRRSPMPRSRSEAMMCGVIPVSLRNHDVDHFIINGLNGFYGDSPEELADAVRFLLGNETARLAMASAARETAAQTFNHDRFMSDWIVMLKDLGF